MLVGCGVRAVERGMKVRYLVAADLIETLYRGLADNTVGRVIGQLLRNELILIDELGFAPLDDTGSQLLFRFVAAAHERRSLGVASHWPFEDWGHFLPVQTTAVSLLDRLLHHAVVNVFNELLPPVHQAGAERVFCEPTKRRAGELIRADQRERPVRRNAGMVRQGQFDGKRRRTIRISGHRDSVLNTLGTRTR